MNTVILIGRWAQDVEMRYTPNGKEVASGNLAVSDGYGDNKHTSYIPIVMWGKVAENTAQYSGDKGRQVAIEGRLSQRSFEKDGQKRYVLEVVASNVEFIGSKEKKEQPEMSDPFGDPFANAGKPINISDDDLPF
ncbi:hypothetical protein ABH14_16875 [Brevibacillus brevis]|uniref:single-stranded DNA-binding protein n=1 Tax=Brevibacillus brevis TaxID=1393 RepID=UPI0018FF8250|nr:single-stranded DNA-binding protein [Brevibacillus brevis]MBH0331450.1 hypothetical protein [Brevibacillus brevis]